MNQTVRTGSGPLSTGVPGLDEVLRGGLPRNRLYLLEGRPGTGKTTIGFQFLMEGVKRGEKGLFISLSDTREELQATAEVHGWPIESITLLESVDRAEWTESKAGYTLFHPSETELARKMEQIQRQAATLGALRVVIDSMADLRLLARDPFRYRRQVVALKHLFMSQGATVLALDDMSAQPADFTVHSSVHGVIHLSVIKMPYGPDRRSLRVEKLRDVDFAAGSHDCRIVRGGLIVFPRLIAVEHPQSPPHGVQPSGIGQLDALLGGGLNLGTSTLISGPAGVGKSVIASQFVAHAGTQGANGVIYTFDESRHTLLLRAAGLGIPLAELESTGRIAIEQVDPAELTPGEFARRVVERVSKHNARVIVIDSLNGYLNAMPEERFLTTHMHELLTIVIEAQHGMVGASTHSALDVSYLADTVILIRYFETSGHIRRALSVLKKRGGRHETSIRELLIGPGLRVGEPLRSFEGVLTGVPRCVDDGGTSNGRG
jgi:circadian clock protein KaiC